MPGTTNDCFCKPTDVAVASSGVFFVADGYCNSRIMKFDKDGKFLAKFGEEGMITFYYKYIMGENAHYLYETLTLPSCPLGWIWKDGKGSSLAIPHSLALIEEEDVLCVADREHRRVLCINAGLTAGEHFGEVISVTNGVYVGRVFGISYSSMSILFIFSLSRCYFSIYSHNLPSFVKP
jgi:peptidylamidoglycolate lyase